MFYSGWTNSLELGIPLTLIGEAVFARFLSALKSERIKASKVLADPQLQLQLQLQFNLNSG